MNISKIYKVQDIEFKTIISTAKSYSECLRLIGLKTIGGCSTKILKARIEELHLDVKHFHPYSKESKFLCKIPTNVICVENSTYRNTSKLKHRLIKEGLLKDVCNICQINEWNGKLISLQLDHINGKNTDNRLSNLRILCPNCHSQTETYAGKKLKQTVTKKPRPTKINWPSLEEMQALINNNSVVKIAKDLNVSDNAVHKFCKKNSIKKDPGVTSTLSACN